MDDTLQVAPTLKEHGGGIMRSCSKSVAECQEYLNSQPLPANIRGVAPLLLRELMPELTLTALENLKKGSSPWMDSLQKFFRHFRRTWSPGCMRH